MYSLDKEEKTLEKNKESFTSNVSIDRNADAVKNTEASSNAKTDNAESVNF